MKCAGDRSSFLSTHETLLMVPCERCRSATSRLQLQTFPALNGMHFRLGAVKYEEGLLAFLPTCRVRTAVRQLGHSVGSL